MSDSPALPVIAGFAVGIAFVVLFASLFSSASPVEQSFIVDNAFKRAIDKTSDLDEVSAFLSYYPNANTTVYFITTCADKSCETLIRLPKTVEYWHKDEVISKIALLRISIDERDEEKPPSFFQVSCQLQGTEVADEIHASRISEKDITEFLKNHDRCP